MSHHNSSAVGCTKELPFAFKLILKSRRNLSKYEERNYVNWVQGRLKLMVYKQPSHVEKHMASYRCCLRMCFLGLVIASLCSVVFILTRGYLLIYIDPAAETMNYYTLIGQKHELRNIYEGGGNYSKITCKPSKFEDILLVIAFVEILYDSIPYLEQLYRNYFPNIIYCIPAKPAEKLEYPVVVVDMLHGVTAYECLSTAIRTNPGITGYLFMRNDLFLNFWSIANFNRSRIWESAGQLGNQVMFQQPRENWIWWYTPWGLNACEQAYKDVIYLKDAYKRAIIDKKVQGSSWDVENSLNALLWNGRGENMCYRASSNLFYIPSEHASAFEKLSAVFQKHQVYTEIAVPTIIRMLDLIEKAEQLPGINLGLLYGEERAQNDDRLLWRHLTTSISYIRPVVLRHKFASETRTPNLIELLLNRLNKYKDTGCSDTYT